MNGIQTSIVGRAHQSKGESAANLFEGQIQISDAFDDLTVDLAHYCAAK